MQLTTNSLAVAYWDAVTRHRKEVELIPIEDLPRRRKITTDFHVKMSLLVDRLLDSSKTASADEWFAIGDAYQSGTGTAKSREQALRWFRKAADEGHVRSMVRLGIALNHPDHQVSWGEAVRWFKGAADSGDASGMTFLGFAYREGHGVAQDYGQAVSWFIKAVAAGDTHSMIHAGRVLARHLNSHVEALSWFLRAADHGHKDSFVELAIVYDQPGTPVYDPIEAVKWYKIVADGSTGSRLRAMLALAIHCRDGDGTARDIAAATEWLNRLMQSTREKSAEHREAIKMMKRIKKNLSQ